VESIKTTTCTAAGVMEYVTAPTRNRLKKGHMMFYDMNVQQMNIEPNFETSFIHWRCIRG
jgi:hypothetical protein